MKIKNSNKSNWSEDGFTFEKILEKEKGRGINGKHKKGPWLGLGSLYKKKMMKRKEIVCIEALDKL